MAEELDPKPEGDEEIDEWGLVESSHERGDSQKSGPYVKVSKNGYVEAMVEATAMTDAIARSRDLAPHRWVLELRGNEKKSQVGCIPIPIEQARPGSVAVRRYEGKGSPRIAFHIGGVFTDYPSMRLKADIKCPIAQGTAPDGRPMLVIPLKAKLSTQTTTRQSGAESPGSESAAGEDPNG